MICPDCRNSEMIETRETIRYDESGLKNIVLNDIKVRSCPKCASKLVSIPNIEGLHKVLAVELITQQERLSAEEIIFLRKYLGWSKKDFAKKFHTSPSQISRWESLTKPVKMKVQS